MSSLKKFVIIFAFTTLPILLFVFLIKIFGKNIIFILIFVTHGYFIIKNGIKKDDFELKKIFNGNIECGGVALIWLLIASLIWIILINI